MMSKFLRHIILWFLVLPIGMVVCLPLLPSRELFETGEREMAINERWLGKDRHDRIVTGTSEWFRSVFVDTGIYSGSFNALRPRESGGLHLKAERAMTDATGHWVYNAWATVYRACYRIHANAPWYLVLIAVIFATAVDGLGQRKINQHEFGYNNPSVFHLTTHLLIAKFGLVFVLLPLLPVVLTTLVWPAVIAVFAFVVWKAAVNFQTGA